jgi:hypothetical protein
MRKRMLRSAILVAALAVVSSPVSAASSAALVCQSDFNGNCWCAVLGVCSGYECNGSSGTACDRIS